MNLPEYLASREDQKVAFNLYRELPDYSEVSLAGLNEYSYSIQRAVADLIASHACSTCGRSHRPNWSTCSCGETNDDYFETLGALVESHPIGRAGSTGMRGSNIDPER